MNSSSTAPQAFDYRKVLQLIFFATMMISCVLSNSNALAASVMPSDYRLTAANDKFADTWQFAASFRIRPPRRLRAKRMELAIGTISTTEESRVFVSFGPVWRLPIMSRTLFFEIGISPTLISGSSFHGRDMGGNFHFTSSAAIGASVGENDALSLSLRIQHTSNGGLSNTNPGMDMIGINISFNP